MSTQANLETAADPATMLHAKEGRVTWLVAGGWGMGSFAASTMYQAIGIFLMHYFVEIIGIAAVTAGALLSAVRLYDAFIDPLVGTASDYTKSRWGRRRPYILAGGLISGLSFILLFSLPTAETTPAIVWIVLGVLLINTTGYAILTIPYLAMPAEMTDKPNERTFIVSFRVAGMALGQISGATITSLVIAAFGGGLIGHSAMAWVTALIIILAAIVCFWLTGRAPNIERAPPPHMSIWQKWSSALSNKPFLLLLLVKMANLTGVHFFFALIPFLFVSHHGLGYEVIGFFFLFQAMGMFGSQPFWVRVAKPLGKKGLYFLGAVLWSACVASLALVDPAGSMAVIAVLAFTLGIAAGSLLLAGQAMLPDAIAADFEKTGQRREGLFAGVYTTVEKISGALAAVLIGASLTAIGFEGGGHGGGDAGEMASAGSNAILWLALIPGIFQFFSAIPLFFYHIPKKEEAPQSA